MSKSYQSSRWFLSTILVLTFVCGQSVWAQNEKKDEKQEVKKVETDKKESKKDDKTAVKSTATGRLPVIIIPGLIGSELVNKNTNDKVWFDLVRAKDDDLRLPISPNIRANKDNLVPGDILREVQLIKFTPKIEIYEKLIEALQADGFKEGKIDFPEAGGDADTFYVFPYDWRLDNVENSQILIQKLDNLRAKLNRPDLKVNVIAHSMGGLIARYAEMYGKSDLTTRPRPNWRGANYFNTISLIATPNAGATRTLDSMVNGFSLFGSGKINLPFVQNLSRADLFTVPSIYQLLPHTGAVRAFDENLKPLRVDLYNPLTWEKYGWAVYMDDDFTKKFDAGEQKQAKNYLRAVLLRAKQFQAALDVVAPSKTVVPTYYLGAECRQTVDGMILRYDSDKKKWKTEFEPGEYKKSDGTKVSKEETEKVLLAPGDGVVPKHSLMSSVFRLTKKQEESSSFILNVAPDACSEHNRLTGDATVSGRLLNLLNGKGFIESSAIKAVK